METLRNVKVTTYDDFIKQDLNNFCKAFVNIMSKCNAIKSNMTETFDSCLCHTRTKPLIIML